MYRKNRIKKTSITVNIVKEGETIEQKIKRAMHQGSPISDGAPRIYQEREDGVNADYDVRADRMEMAAEAMDKASRTYIAQREARIIEMKEKNATGGETDGTTQN